VSKLVVRALPELLSFIVDNRGRSCPTTESGFPLIATNCLKPGIRSPIFENIRYVSTETYRTWFRAHPEPGDVLFVCKGSPGRVAVVPDPVSFCIAQDMVSLRADRDVVDPLYLYYRLTSKDVQDSIITMHVGTMIPHFKKGDFGKLRFTVHESLVEQQAIAGVLGALDDKITANDRTILLLRQLARGSFDSALQAGARDVTVGEIAKFHNRRRVPLSSRERELRQGTVPYYGAAGRVDYVDEAIFDDRLLLVGEDGSVITDMGTPVFQYIWGPSWVNNHAHVITGDGISTEALRVALERANISHLVTGAVQPKLNMGNLKKLEITIPDDLAVLDDSIQDLTATERALVEESAHLTTVRNEILPLLMSGKMRVRAAGKAVEEAV
jgi:type I restriction enzyme S subunit